MIGLFRQPVVHFPIELEHHDFFGSLYGYFHPDSNQYNIVSYAAPGEPQRNHQTTAIIGEIVSPGQEDTSENASPLVGIRTQAGLIFRARNTVCAKEPYELLQNIFSRNTGILETDVMLDKGAIISGCGSVGSLVALELARAGVGSFLLIDNDTLSYHNLCRHQCGVLDVGKFKVNALQERILQINPSANIFAYANIIEGVPKETFDAFCNPGTLLVGCADNREGDVYASTISCLYQIPFVSIGLWERAFAGEIFYSLPGEMPCYACPFGTATNSVSARSSTNRRIYTTHQDITQINFEPGISTDISFVTLIAVKLILDLLNRETPHYIPRVLNYLSQFTLVCNTNDTRIAGEQAEIFSHPLQVTTSIKVSYKDPCPPCKLL